MMAELYDLASRSLFSIKNSTPNASHRLSCAFFTVCWEISSLNNTPMTGTCKCWQVMDGTVVDARKIIHTEFRHFADSLKFALSLN